MSETFSDLESVRHELYTVMQQDDLSVTQKQERALSVARTWLDVENAHIQVRNRDREIDTVVVSVGADSILPVGTTLDRTKTYCRRTIEESTPIALSDAPDQGWDEDPAYREHGFDCYLGTTIFVAGETYGTVCFISRDPRSREFSDSEKMFVELLARLLGRELESATRDQQLKQQQQARKRLENKYELLLEQAPDAIFFAKAETGDIVEINRKATELTGYTAVELRGKSVLELHPDEHRERYKQLLDSTHQEGSVSQFDDGDQLYIRTATGQDIPVELSVSRIEWDEKVFLQGIVRDISERREREQELRLKSQAIDESTVGITIADASQPDTPIVYANDGFERLTGYPKERVIGENCRFLQGEDTDPETVEAIRTAIDAQEPIQTGILNYRADGMPFWNQLSITPVPNERGEITHFVGIQEDITPKKRRERLISVLQRVLRHNLRNSMTAVGGLAGEIAAQATDDIARMADRIQRQTDDVIQLAEKARCLEQSLFEDQPVRQRDAADPVHSVAEDLRSEYPDVHVGVKIHATDPIPATNQLKLALRELGENAVKHTEEGRVTYHVDTTGDDSVVIRVSDTGRGIPESEQQVLESGYETPLEHGIGLGTWLVNWIVTGLGGSVTTTVEDGTTVTLRLPCAADSDLTCLPPQAGVAPGSYMD